MTTRATTPPAEMSSEEFETYLELPASDRPELSFDDYLALPECRRRLEVIDGVIVMSPGTTLWHQDFGFELAVAIRGFVKPRGLGRIVLAPADVLIRRRPKLQVRQPDLYFIAAAKLAGLDPERVSVLEVPPDLVVEIRSGSERPKLWAEKLADYASIGVTEVWRVHQKPHSIEAMELRDGQYARLRTFGREDILTSVVLPGLAIPLGPLFTI